MGLFGLFGTSESKDNLVQYQAPKFKGIELPICFSISAASSCVARGITPGSEKDVRNSVDTTKTNKSPPMAGIAAVIFSARYGQLLIKQNPALLLLEFSSLAFQ